MIFWKSHPAQSLSFKEAWQIMRSRSVEVDWAPLVWHSLMLPRVSFFALGMMHRKAPTHAWAQSVGISLASMCCLCNKNLETDLHLLFLCPFFFSFLLKEKHYLIRKDLVTKEAKHQTIDTKRAFSLIKSYKRSCAPKKRLIINVSLHVRCCARNSSYALLQLLFRKGYCKRLESGLLLQFLPP